jgi:hypothetical protein
VGQGVGQEDIKKPIVFTEQSVILYLWRRSSPPNRDSKKFKRRLNHCYLTASYKKIVQQDSLKYTVIQRQG